MRYLTYCGNTLTNARLPEGSSVLYPPPALPGLSRAQVGPAVRRAVEHPHGMSPLRELVGSTSRVLIAFDDNCQPFPMTPRPDFRELAIETLLELLDDYGVEKSNITLMCAVALHRKMKPAELERMVGKRIMREFYPSRLLNFDAEDRENLVYLGDTDEGEPVEIDRRAAEADLVLYVDSVQIPLNGGHKAVGIGLGSYRTIANHHTPRMTADVPHVMQPHGSRMHASIERIGRVVEEHCKIMMVVAPMNGDAYPPHLRFLGKSPEDCGALERLARRVTPWTMPLMPEALRAAIFSSLKTSYSPLAIYAGSVDAVHPLTLEAVNSQLRVNVGRQFDTLVFGLPDLSPYSVGARMNPVLVVSDVLGYIFNWFYDRPLVRPGGSVIILNPVFESFHPEYHVAYRRFYEEVMPVATEPFEMQEKFQESFANDPDLIDAYRNRYAHHGFHPFTVWYWATYPLKYLSRVILVGPRDDRQAKRLGVGWAPSLADALAESRQNGRDDVVGLTIPPFFYVTADGG